MDGRIESLVNKMTDEDKCKLAGEILGQVNNPDQSNLHIFFEELKNESETNYGEVISRAADLCEQDGETGDPVA